MSVKNGWLNPRFLLLIALFAIAVLLAQASVPVLEGNDEALHYNYVLWLRSEHRLPERNPSDLGTMGQERGQPPLTYWVAATLLDLINAPRHYDDPWRALDDVRNIWFTPPDWSNRGDNFNLFFHGVGEQAFGHADMVYGDRVARLISLVYGLLAVIGANGAAREVFPRKEWALLATAIFAFMPQMVYMSATLTNDVSSTAFATLTIWQTLRLLRRGASPIQLIVIGVLLAFSGLSKVNALLIAPGVGLALIVDWRHRQRSIRRLLGNLALLAAVFCLIFGPWVVYGAVNYHDPLGLGTHLDPSHPADPVGLGQMASALSGVYLSYWAKFGTSSVWMNPAIYVLFSVVALLAAVGYVLRWRSRRSLGTMRRQQTLILAVILFAGLLGLAYWLRTLFGVAFAITGRLIYPVHVAVAIGLTGGLYWLAGRRSRRFSRLVRGYTIGILVGASVILTPLTITAIYRPPTLLSRDQLPPLRGGPIDFSHTIRFLGYTQADTTIRSGTLHRMTLCWDVLQTTTIPVAFSIKVFDGPQIVGDRTSIHGMGHYNSTQWQPGDIFCDNVDVPITGPLQAGRTYNVILVLLNARSLAVDWQATDGSGTPIQFPLIAQLQSP